jgi:hypothetical protein
VGKAAALRRIAKLAARGMERRMLEYADRPLDFADATLVRLAEREGSTPSSR